VPYAILSEREFGTLGSALIAAAAVGDVEDLTETVLEINKELEIVDPDKKSARRYREYFTNYEATIEGLIDIFNKYPGP
jgi:sugar (pentulose or hexulose) kinase